MMLTTKTEHEQTGSRESNGERERETVWMELEVKLDRLID